MREQYQSRGFGILRELWEAAEVARLAAVLTRFHDEWCARNEAALGRGVINSAYLTSREILDEDERLTLFSFIASGALMGVVNDLIEGPAFLNTQLFFDPQETEQQNYWHRDVQYLGVPVAEQKRLLREVNVIHFRVPLVDERGLEVVPGTHHRWDSSQEEDVRLARNGCHVWDSLPDTEILDLNAGDLGVFSANMIHRGLYGGNRMAFDVIFCDSNPELLTHLDPMCLPDEDAIADLEDPSAFIRSRKIAAEAAPRRR